MRNGLFPTAPRRPTQAISLNLLDFCRALFERSCEAVNALAGALHTFYGRRGFHAVTPEVRRHIELRCPRHSIVFQGTPHNDPFRRPLAQAIQWYDSLRVMMGREVDSALEACATRIEESLPCQGAPHLTATPGSPPPPLPSVPPPEVPVYAPPPLPNVPPPEAPVYGPPPPIRLTPGSAARILQQRCPACFGSKTWGRPLNE